MSPRSNTLLIAANAGLVVALVFLAAGRGSSPRTDQTPLKTSPAATERVPEAVPSTPVYVTNDLRWAQLESEDYSTYIARLRSIGCPEQTIRDIIIADVEKLISPKMQAIYKRRPNLSYWQSEEEELANNHDHREWQRQEREVEDEKRRLIQDLVGVDLVRERLKQRGYEDYYERRLKFLPEEKRGALRQVLDKYDDLERSIRAKETEEGEALTAQDKEKLRLARQQREAEISGMLTPEEQRSYDLWMSTSANEVRRSMYGMEATEQEFLSVYNLRHQFDAQWDPDNVDWTRPESVQAWQDARGKLDQQIQEALGPERYQLYKRGEDPDFHQINAAISRYKLPRQTAAEVYEIKEAVRQMTLELQQNPSLTSAQREEAMRAMARETEITLRQTLGNSAYRYLRQRTQSDWLGGIGQ